MANDVRTINIHLPNDFIDTHNISTEAYFLAIGYLSWWNRNYALLDIYDENNGGDFVAIYRNEPNGTVQYAIGAIWHEDALRYSFHS